MFNVVFFTLALFVLDIWEKQKKKRKDIIEWKTDRRKKFSEVNVPAPITLWMEFAMVWLA